MYELGISGISPLDLWVTETMKTTKREPVDKVRQPFTETHEVTS